MGETGSQAEDGGWAQRRDGKKGKRLQSSWKCVACRQRWVKPAAEGKSFFFLFHRFIKSAGSNFFIPGSGYLV